MKALLSRNKPSAGGFLKSKRVLLLADISKSQRSDNMEPRHEEVLGGFPFPIWLSRFIVLHISDPGVGGRRFGFIFRRDINYNLQKCAY
jgi:hypothetical protein